jgi:HEAT repeat protein
MGRQGMDVQRIIQLLEEPTTDRRPVVDRLEVEASRDELIKALEMSTAPLTRQIICDMLGRRHEAAAVPRLLEALNDISPKVRGAAADALAKVGSEGSGVQIMKRLNVEQDNGVRQMLVLAIGSVRYRPAVPYLVELLRDADPAIRGCAAWSLGSLRAKEAMGYLAEALNKELDIYAKERFAEALESIART